MNYREFLSRIPAPLRYWLCIHNITSYCATYIKREDLKVETENYNGYSVTWPHECSICGHMISYNPYTSDNGFRVIGPRDGYPQEFLDAYRAIVDFKESEVGSWWLCEFPMDCYLIYKNQGIDAMKSHMQNILPATMRKS